MTLSLRQNNTTKTLNTDEVVGFVAPPRTGITSLNPNIQGQSVTDFDLCS